MKKIYDSNLNKKSVLITGGTGSFGSTLLLHLLQTDVERIVVFSRDEKKQDDLRRKIKDNKIEFIIGDVRDKQIIQRAMRGIELVFHAAALKQVPSNEFFPLEATKTNIIGTHNVIDAAIEAEVNQLVLLSTDKAVYPINAMGISKAMAEKIALAEARYSSLRKLKTSITITRYGNVMGSRGSVIPIFVENIKNNIPIKITDLKMTRFLMSLNESVDLVMQSFKSGNNGDIYVRKAPSCTVDTLAKALMKILNKTVPIELIGPRHGEKYHETLISKEEMSKAEDLGLYFRIPMDERNINYDKFYSDGNIDAIKSVEYTSENTYILNIDETIELIKKVV
jgi:UDP-N-acetylglucosamine 4,6-dehydratase